MLIALHKNARTTPAVRAEIAASTETASVLAQRFGITEQTVYKWKKRSVFGDRSHTAHHLQTLLHYVALYNHQLPQSALKSKTPMQAMKVWYQTHPHLFHKRPYDRPGCDR